MPIMRAGAATLLVIDFQPRLMAAIHLGAEAIANAKRLLDAAALLDVPVLVTEQNPEKLGGTVAELATDRATPIAKLSFDACDAPDFLAALPPAHDVVVTGCEAHVCVLQTVLGLRAAGRGVFVVEDAIGSRAPANKAAALRRMAAHGAEIVTTEMVAFEWLRSAAHPRFRPVVALIK
ncbi:Isochorismatase [Rhodovastum atsumiense]|uniref:Isochorismatase family protein n=1 Tax=Rhodovastum atsumiense TaxID=504468 RepID=A0A5M6IRC4_9PROT|nr:isochorismatase family protein [Rhodovastum atsumiense]KAA5610836.1 isochorismatase family protein [Rhodovastum atsumiense]CAH2602117.1 Isochorismatase [Rhodovastum atsumiense]